MIKVETKKFLAILSVGVFSSCLTVPTLAEDKPADRTFPKLSQDYAVNSTETSEHNSFNFFFECVSFVLILGMGVYYAIVKFNLLRKPPENKHVISNKVLLAFLIAIALCIILFLLL